MKMKMRVGFRIWKKSFVKSWHPPFLRCAAVIWAEQHQSERPRCQSASRLQRVWTSDVEFMEQELFFGDFWEDRRPWGITSASATILMTSPWKHKKNPPYSHCKMKPKQVCYSLHQLFTSTSNLISTGNHKNLLTCAIQSNISPGRRPGVTWNSIWGLRLWVCGFPCGEMMQVQKIKELIWKEDGCSSAYPKTMQSFPRYGRLWLSTKCCSAWKWKFKARQQKLLMHLQRQLCIIMAFYAMRGEKRIIDKWGHPGCTRDESWTRKERTTDMPKTTTPILQDVTRMYIIFCVCGGICGK